MRWLSVLFSQSFGSTLFYCLAVVTYNRAYKRAYKGIKWCASRFSASISALVKNSTSSEIKGYKDHYATLKDKEHEIALAMPSNWKMDDYLAITLKPKPLFYMLISTMLASISIWLLISSQTVKMRPRAIFLAFASPIENTQLFLWSFYFSYSCIFQYSLQHMKGSCALGNQ